MSRLGNRKWKPSLRKRDAHLSTSVDKMYGVLPQSSWFPTAAPTSNEGATLVDDLRSTTEIVGSNPALRFSAPLLLPFPSSGVLQCRHVKLNCSLSLPAPLAHPLLWSLMNA